MNWKEEFGQKFPSKIAEVIDDFGSPTKSDIEAFIQSKFAELFIDAQDYLQHTSDCILSYFEAGRPTKDGYEEKFRGKWYQARPIDETPKCNCGLKELYETWL